MLDWEGTYRLSRFVLLRTDGNGFVIESPLNTLQFPVAGPSVLRILEVLTRPHRLDSLLAAVGEQQQPVVKALMEGIFKAGLLTRVGEDGLTEEETSSMSHWEFHDLLFHASSRMGRNRKRIGGTYRLKGRVPSEPAEVSHPHTGDCVVLPSPSSEPVEEPGFFRVLERRRSSHRLQPMTLEDLGEFLFRCCRITRRIGDGEDEVVQKVYPSGGSLHPLRVFTAVTSCQGCEPGLYLYRPEEHALARIRGLDAAVERLLLDARNSAGGLPEHPPVLLIISARFRRTAWKYESIAYRLMLMEVGTLLQTMYLVAAALGLSACALGSGDSDHFAKTIGSEYYLETSVGEFMLGGK